MKSDFRQQDTKRRASFYFYWLTLKETASMAAAAVIKKENTFHLMLKASFVPEIKPNSSGSWREARFSLRALPVSLGPGAPTFQHWAALLLLGKGAGATRCPHCSGSTAPVYLSSGPRRRTLWVFVSPQKLVLEHIPTRSMGFKCSVLSERALKHCMINGNTAKKHASKIDCTYFPGASGSADFFGARHSFW